MAEQKKASILLILKVLEKYSDEEHYLTQQDIIKHISEDYGIELERKSVSSSLSLLETLGYDINKTRKGTALFSRILDKSEIRYITDALFSSHSISGEKAIALVDKINSCLSDYQKQDFSYIQKSSLINRINNDDIFYTIELIEECKKLKKRLSFEYITYDEQGQPVSSMNGWRFKVSPYYSVNSNGRYYLICHYRDKRGPITIFKIDYIKNPKIEEEWEYQPIESIQGLEDFDICTYLNENIYLFGGDVINATILLNTPGAIKSIKDWFGDNAKIYTDDHKLYADIRCNEQALFYWYMQYSETLTIISPQSLIDRVKNEAQKIYQKYNTQENKQENAEYKKEK